MWMKPECGYQPTPPRCIARALVIASESLDLETHIERPADDMLAVLGYAEGRAREHRVGLGRAIGRKDRRSGFADRIEDIGQKIDDPDIDLRLFAGMMVAQKNAKFVDHPVDRALVVAVGAFEGLAGMGIDEAQPAQRSRPGAEPPAPPTASAARIRPSRTETDVDSFPSSFRDPDLVRSPESVDRRRSADNLRKREV